MSRPAFRSILRCGITVIVGLAAACGSGGDLGALGVADASTGWYTAGDIGLSSRFVPAVTFRLKNNGTASIDDVDLFLSFWPDGADGEKDSQQIAGVRAEPLAPGAETTPIAVRSTVGYNLAQPTPDLFSHSQFKDWTVRVFARRGGQTVRLGEFKIERRAVGDDVRPL